MKIRMDYFSYISWRLVLMVEETRVLWGNPPICRKSLTNFITECCIEYTSQWAGFEFTTLVVIGTDCIGSCKSNCHTIMTTTDVSCRMRVMGSLTWNRKIYFYNRKIWIFTVKSPMVDGVQSLGPGLKMGSNEEIKLRYYSLI